MDDDAIIDDAAAVATVAIVTDELLNLIEVEL